MGFCIQPQLKHDNSFSIYKWGLPTAEAMELIDLLMERQWEKIFLRAYKYKGHYQAESCQQAALRNQADGKLGRAVCAAPDSD